MIPQLTGIGRNLLIRTLAGETNLNFTSVHFGSGASQTVTSATALASDKLTVGITSIQKGNQYVTIKCNFNNNSINTGFRATEIGFFVTDPDDEDNEVLYAIGFESDASADYIPAHSTRAFEMHFDSIMYIGDIQDITATISQSAIYVTKEEFDSHVDDFEDHMSDKNNPHTVTKSQVGLGNVPNVTTNNQQPTFTEASALATINSGETLTSILGKIKKLFTSYINRVKVFKNVSVSQGSWVADSTDGYPEYYADITLSGITEDYTPFVCFDVLDCMDGNFTGFSKSYNGKVRIWASSIPEGSITIPNIMCIRE